MNNPKVYGIIAQFEKLKRELETLKGANKKREENHGKDKGEDKVVSEEAFKKHQEAEKKRKELNDEEEKAAAKIEYVAASEDEYKAHQEMMARERKNKKEAAPVFAAASEDEFKAFLAQQDEARKMTQEKKLDEEKERDFIQQEADELDLQNAAEAKPDWLDEISDV